MRVAMVAAAAVAAAACGGPEVREPPPEFDDLDPETELRGPKVLGPPRIIDAERLADVLEGLPYEGRYGKSRHT
jgi:hypothetical protein